MDSLHSSSHKRPILDDSSETTPPISDHQTKRMRLTLPPISATLPTPSSSFPSFQLPIPPIEPNSGNLPILPPISATDSPVLPISSPRSLSGQQQQHHELPHIDSLGKIDKNVGENEVNEINEDDQDDEFSLDRSLFEGLYLQREPHLIVKNDDSLNMEGREEHHLGHMIYDPNKILPPLEFHENGILEVRVSSKHLTWNNKKVRSRFLWGTDIYTDDSDVVAVLIHTGYFIPPISKWSSDPPDHDLCVTIRVLPKLVQYTATVRNQYQSRSWGNHHGVSYKIEKNGEAIGRSISKGRKERLRKFHQMRKRAFQGTEYDRGDESIIVFNNDGDPCLKYNLSLMSNDEHIKEKLRNEVLYLENDEERDKYRFAIVSSATYLGLSAILKDNQERDNSQPNFPLDESHLEEIIRDDLDFHEMSWNILGVIVEDKIDSSRVT
ncbi:11865_t:CDS:2 [Diversispora eburnea]|uniref:11865_t:CDS:1 n=1 Tax=Diversispora eburnea TaxID=1213867 RepID=A0A9N8YRP4_9GLOM|nr:11865_t:CDS:2 [Diversispora eburnea]